MDKILYFFNARKLYDIPWAIYPQSPHIVIRLKPTGEKFHTYRNSGSSHFQSLHDNENFNSKFIS